MATRRALPFLCRLTALAGGEAPEGACPIPPTAWPERTGAGDWATAAPPTPTRATRTANRTRMVVPPIVVCPGPKYDQCCLSSQPPERLSLHGRRPTAAHVKTMRMIDAAPA